MSSPWLPSWKKRECPDRGRGRYIRTSGQRAEVAFLIGDAFQGLGIASLLFKHLVAIARDSGVTQFEAEVLPSNEAMLKVFSRSGIPVTRTGRATPSTC